MSEKLGLSNPRPADAELIKGLLEIMSDEKADYTNTFRALSRFSTEDPNANLFDSQSYREWAESYRLRLRDEASEDSERRAAMESVNPKFVLRNYLAERAIRKAEDEQDYTEIERLHNVLRNPFSEQPEFEDYAKPSPEGKALVISCSS